MNLFNTILVNAGLFVRWAAGGLADGLGSFFHGLSQAVNPVLSPLLTWLDPMSSAVGDAVFAMTAALPVWAELTLLSLLLGVVMLVGFRYTSNQQGIADAKDKIKANLLSLKLYKDELRVTFLSQWRLLKAIGKLQRHMLFPVVIMAVPMLLALAQLGVRYQWEPVAVGDRALVHVKLADQVPADSTVELVVPKGVVAETPGIPGGGEVVWRVRGERAGVYPLQFSVEGGKSIAKTLVVGQTRGAISAVRTSSHWVTQLLHPLETPLPTDSVIQSIEIDYPSRHSWFDGSDHWVISFFVLSMLAALLLAPVFRVRF